MNYKIPTSKSKMEPAIFRNIFVDSGISWKRQKSKGDFCIGFRSFEIILSRLLNMHLKKMITGVTFNS